MADTLALLFELDADGRPAIAEFQRVRKAFAGELDALRRSVAQSFTLPPIKLPTAPTGRAGGSRADAHIKDFKRIEAEAAKSAKAQEKEQQRLNSAVQSLQRQRSAALLRAFKDEERAAAASARAQERAAQQAAKAISNAFRGIGQGLQSVGRTLTIGITAPLLALGAGALKSAKDLDANVNTLKAFTGSAEAAERRLAQLIKTARGTPGLTTNLALTLDAQLRVAKVTQETIDRVLPAIGRLNAVSKLPDVGRFTNNLVQLVTQNFEKQDLKELIGQSPLAGQLITQIFDVDSATNAKAIRAQAKKLGITTIDAFFTAFAEAAAKNQGLQNVTESIGTRFDKIVDRVTVALRPLGLAIINSIQPFIEPASQLVERIGAAFDSLSQPVKTLIILFGGLAAATGPALFILGGLVNTVGSLIGAYVQLATLGLTPTIKGFQLLAQVMRGTAALTAGQAATTAAAAAGWTALGGVVVIAAAAIVGAYLLLSGSQKEAVKISAEQVEVTKDQISTLKAQISFVDSLTRGVKRTADEQGRLAGIYATLNTQAKIRLTAITDEEKRLEEMREVLRQILQLRNAELVQQSANLAASLADTAQQIQANQQERDSIAARVQANTQLAQAIAENGKITAAQSKALALQGINAAQAEEAIGALNAENESLIASQDALVKLSAEFNGTAAEQSKTLAVLEKQTGLSARELLAAAKAMGLLKTDVESALRGIEAFRSQQDQSAAATKGNTAEIDEQTRSLKALRRALKEAEIAARERSAATRRALEEDRISSREATERQIRDARTLAAEQTKEIDQTLEAKRKELEASKADADAAQKLEEEIAELEVKKRQIKSETALEILNLRSEQLRREREGETAHQATLLEIQRTTAQKQIDALRERMEREESFRLEGERQIITIEQDISKAEEDEIRRRLRLVAEGSDARKILEDDLGKFLEEKSRQRAEQARRLAKAELDNALLPVRRQQREDRAADAGDAGVIARLQSVADAGSATFEATEKQIGKIIDTGFERRIKRLKDEIKIRQEHNQDVSELNADLRTLEQERQNAAEETDRAIEHGRETDLDRARSYRDRLKSIYSGIAETVLELRNRVVDALRRGLAPERQIIDEENKLALAREELRHAQVSGEIQESIDRLEALQKRRKLNGQELKELKAHREALKAESDLNKSNQEEIERQRRIGLERANPNSTRSLFGDVFADAAEAIRAAAAAADVAVSNLAVTLGSFGAAAAEHFANASFQAGNFISILLDGIDQINAGLADMLGNWILTGETGSAALRKLLASTIAYYAKTFLIKALDNVGEGFSNLAKAAAAAATGNLASAALYKTAAVQNFISAAKYGIASAATAVAGRFAAGDSFKQRDTAGRAINGGADAEPRNATFNFGGPGLVETSSQAARDGSGGGIFGRLTTRIEQLQQQNLEIQRQQQLHNAQVTQVLNKFNTARPGDVVTAGASDARQAIGVAVIDHSNSSGDFNETLQRNLGFA